MLCTCFVVSSVAALVYQTAWTRQFAIVFGTSELAVAVVEAGVNAPESLHKDASALRNVLDEVAKFPQVDAARIAEVRAEIAALSSSLVTN